MLNNMNFSLNLIRHGESEGNVNPDMMGQAGDTPLTKKGQWQAIQLQERLYKDNKNYNFERVYCSTYLRAEHTAKLALGDKHPISYYRELREYEAGDWSNCSRKEKITEDVKKQMSAQNMSFQPPNGESLTQVERRASKWLEDTILYNKEIIDMCKGGNNINILCFSHGMTIKTLLHYIMGFDKNFTWKINIDNTSVTKLTFGKDGWFLNYLNDYSHLKD